jgi:hypothetical protein
LRDYFARLITPETRDQLGDFEQFILFDEVERAGVPFPSA